jgi:hypothetical protein
MPTPITTVTKTFTYNIADELFGNTVEDGRTADASYTGPDRVWVFVDENTGQLTRIYPPLTSQEDGGEVPVPVGTVRVEVTAENDIQILAMLKEDCVTYTDTTQTTEALPAGYGSVLYNNTATLSETYDLDDLVRDFDTNTWNSLPLIDDGITWDQLIASRNVQLGASDGRISPDMPDAVKAPWVEYRQLLRDFPAAYGHGTENEVAAWKVQFPEQPED